MTQYDNTNRGAAIWSHLPGAVTERIYGRTENRNGI